MATRTCCETAKSSSNICVMGVLEEEERQSWQKKIFEEIAIENFSKFAEKYKFTDSRISVIPRRINMKIIIHRRHYMC